MAKKHIKHAQPKKSPVKSKLSYQKIIIGVLAAAVLIFLIYNNFIKKTELEVEYYNFTKEGELILSDSLGNTKAKIDIEIADNDYKRQLGLMKRVSMEEKQGMLFIFPAEAKQAFWMRNTLISLDMVFINSEKEIVTIHKNTKILSDQSYPSSVPAEYVLELNAGFTNKYNIQVGDRISWKRTK
jgi:uncharacterized membrane protein (UPF0127 family)